MALTTQKQGDQLTDHFIRWYGLVLPRGKYKELKFEELREKLREKLEKLEEKYPPLSEAPPQLRIRILRSSHSRQSAWDTGALPGRRRQSGSSICRLRYSYGCFAASARVKAVLDVCAFTAHLRRIYPPVAELNEEQHIIRHQAPPREALPP
jgi:hypothetical protein